MKKSKGTIAIGFSRSDDERLMNSYLSSAGYHTISLYKSYKKPIDLVLLDAASMNTWGQERMRQLKAQDAHFLPILIALPQKEEPALWLQSGLIDDCFYLPVNQAVLITRIGVFLRLRRQDIALAEQSEIRYRTTLKSIGDAVMTTDIQGKGFMFLALNNKGEVTLTNQIGNKILGYEQEEIIGKNWFDSFLPVSAKDQVRGIFDRLMAGEIEQIAYYKNPVVTKGGEERIIAWHSTILKDDEGAIIGTLSSGEDVIDRKRAEEALRKSEVKMRSIFLVAPIGIGVVSNRIILDVNDPFCKITGYSRKELTGRKERMLYPTDEDYEYVGREKYAQIRERGMGTVETRFKRKDGTIIDVLLSSTLLDPTDLSVGVAFTAQDITERKKAEKALLLSRRRYQTFFNDSPIPLWEEEFNELYRYLEQLKERGVRDFRAYFDKNPEELQVCVQKVKIKDVNQAALKLHNAKSKEELLGNLDKIFTEKSYAVFKEEIIAITKGQMEFESEAEVKTLTGELRHIFLRFIIDEDQPDPKRVLIATMDFTERKRAEQALRESEERFATFMDHLPVAVFIKDEQGRALYANKYLDDIFGAREWIGKTTAGLFPKEISEAMFADDQRALEKGYCSIEEAIPDKEGQIRIYQTHKFSIKQKNKPKLIGGIALEITERVIAENALKESEERFRAIFEQAAVGVAQIVSKTGGFVRINQRYADILGYTVEEMEHLNFQEIIHSDDLQEYLDNMKRLLNGEIREFSVQKRYYHKKGSIVWVNLTVSPMWKISEKPNYQIAVVEDITERKQAEEELRKYQQQLESLVDARTAELRAANKELEAFAYSVSHDLRAPLRTIDGFTRILMEDYVANLDDEGKRLGSIIQQNTEKMRQLIDDLLVFSCMGRTAMHFSVIDMKNMANEIYYEATSAEERKRITFTLIALPKTEGDPTMIRQVWMNLISNAVKFSSYRKQARIEITCEQNTNNIIFCIKDNGAGFDMKYKDKLFGVFQRLHPEREFRGTGVGLALVQRIIYRHGGQVWAEGEVDKGAAFYFSLPQKQI